MTIICLDCDVWKSLQIVSQLGQNEMTLRFSVLK
jgi:hypothetical protein